MQGFRLDESRWPVVVMQVEGGYAPHLLESRLRALSALIERKKPFALILDLNQFEGSSEGRIERIQRIRRWREETKGEFDRYCQGVAIVFYNRPVLRLIVGAFLLAIRKPFPHQLFGALDAAFVWAKMLAAA